MNFNVVQYKENNIYKGNTFSSFGEVEYSDKNQSNKETWLKYYYIVEDKCIDMS